MKQPTITIEIETSVLRISIAEGNPKGERKREKRVVAAYSLTGNIQILPVRRQQKGF